LKDIAREQNDTSERKEMIRKSKERIDKIVEDDHWELHDVFKDHNYYVTNDSTVFECVVYFLAG